MEILLILRFFAVVINLHERWRPMARDAAANSTTLPYRLISIHMETVSVDGSCS